MQLNVRAYLALLFMLVASLRVRAEMDLTWSLDEGFSTQADLLKPAKIDYLFRRQAHANEYNLIWWNEQSKGGAGTLDRDGGGAVSFAGGYLRPFVGKVDLGDLILGGLVVDAPLSTDYEIQGEYRLPNGFGFGGGVAVRNGDGPDASFGKLTYRKQLDQWTYLLEVQGQEFSGHASPGAYLAVYNERLMGVYGNDGEQWRFTIGVISPEHQSCGLRPAMEVLYGSRTKKIYQQTYQWSTFVFNWINCPQIGLLSASRRRQLVQLNRKVIHSSASEDFAANGFPFHVWAILRTISSAPAYR